MKAEPSAPPEISENSVSETRFPAKKASSSAPAPKRDPITACRTMPSTAVRTNDPISTPTTRISCG
jgi:hypothetical protein